MRVRVIEVLNLQEPFQKLVNQEFGSYASSFAVARFVKRLNDEYFAIFGESLKQAKTQADRERILNEEVDVDLQFPESVLQDIVEGTNKLTPSDILLMEKFILFGGGNDRGKTEGNTE